MIRRSASLQPRRVPAAAQMPTCVSVFHACYTSTLHMAPQHAMLRSSQRLGAHACKHDSALEVLILCRKLRIATRRPSCSSIPRCALSIASCHQYIYAICLLVASWRDVVKLAQLRLAHAQVKSLAPGDLATLWKEYINQLALVLGRAGEGPVLEPAATRMKKLVQEVGLCLINDCQCTRMHPECQRSIRI